MHEREGGWTEQHAETQAELGPNVSQESFLGSFSRVPSGLDPTQVYSYFLKLSARIQQLEEQAQRVSAPFILEAAMREATEVRTQAAQAAERTYNEVVRVAHEEAERLKREAERQASEIIEEARQTLASAQQQAQETLERARQEAERIRQEAERRNQQIEQELERLCIDFSELLQRLVDHRRAASSAMASLAQITSPRAEPAPGPAPAAPATPASEAAPQQPPTAAPSSARLEAPETAGPSEPPSAAAPPETTATEGASEKGKEDQDRPGGFRLPSWLS